MNNKLIVSSIVLVLLFSLHVSLYAAEQDESSSGNLEQVSEKTGPASNEATVIENEDDLLIQSSKKPYDSFNKVSSYFIQSGGTIPIYDDDFRDFLDYGGSVTLGFKKQIIPKIYLIPTIGFTLLNGDWDTNNGRDSILIEEEGHNVSYPDAISPEDVNDVNLGESYHGEGEATILSAEELLNMDLRTSMYLVPIILNVSYQLHEGGDKINPYFGGGIGFCVAKRDVQSRTLKEQHYRGPDYLLDFNDNQTVTGQVIQFFAGIQIPFYKNMKLVAESTTTLYNLRGFDPIIEIADTNATDPAQGSDVASFSNENPVDIGVFDKEYVTSLSLGLIIPF